jgi:serine/threonine protein kinase
MPRKRALSRKEKPPPPTPARIGHYEILERVGVGGMAEAFRARARGPGGYQRQLIIKCIQPQLADDPEFVRLFVAEAKILGMLNHPNIVQVYDFGEQEGRHFLALEYLDGPSVAQIRNLFRKARMPVPVGVAVYLAREMCLGLAAAHGLVGPDGQPLDVVHRDVTPSNVLTTTAGEVKLVDFGVARIGRGGVTTRAGTVRGKPAYLSPEQILGAALDGRSDLFATGIVLHELLTLEPLFQADSELGTIYRVMEHPIAPPSRLRPGIPPPIDAIVMRALQRSPAARYQSALEMATELSEFLATCAVGRPEIAALAAWYVRAVGARRRAVPTDGAATVVAQICAPGASER